MVAWYVLSNVSYMNLYSGQTRVNARLQQAYRVIKDVLPTLWSPSRTILLRLRGGDEKSAVTGD